MPSTVRIRLHEDPYPLCLEIGHPFVVVVHKEPEVLETLAPLFEELFMGRVALHGLDELDLDAAHHGHA